MTQITGKATIRVDGTELRTAPGATLDTGGEKREPKVGAGKVWGFSEDTQAPEVTCKVYHTADTSLKKLGAITSATLSFECDTGAKFVLREAFVTEPPKLDAKDGTVELKFSAISCDEA
ncbi:Phage tail tube protein [Humidesulfovibrio mexicanus]|uniref:Phage tail tube protein n=1 Tax=Humidesulfovibrio mexicanus TaxID=147047 RepID=A0A239BDC8_9BACT|nr:phage tail tube protein [Humidesulfovibrio mexicanus]SNS05561.1 Phage tail tube protein [Humidesulfovibrio mexicanus]